MPRLPRVPLPAGLILAPGAGADRDDPTLVALERGLPELSVVRLTLATTSVPNAVAKVRAAAVELATALDVSPERLAFGGRSFGGRACSVAVADGLDAAALVLLSYPLHPPGKPERLRTEHFERLRLPTLFVSGDKDPFGRPAEFDAHVSAIPGPVRQEWVAGNHSPKARIDDIVGIVRHYFGLG